MVRDIVADLVRLADAEGLTPKGISRFPELLAKANLSQSDINDAVIADATTRAIEWTNDLLRKARRHNDGLEVGKSDLGGVEEQQEGSLPVKDEPNVAVKVRKAPRVGKVVRGKIFGFSATAVLRWMGSQGWDFEDAGVCLAAYGLGGMSDITIKIQLKAGKDKDPTRGPAAPIDKKQAKELDTNRN